MSATSAATRRVTTAALATLRQRGEPVVWIMAELRSARRPLIEVAW